MRLILKNLWKNRKQNGWIFAEIAIITLLSWFMVDYLVVNTYATYCSTPAGEFEKEHLCVGQFRELRGKWENNEKLMDKTDLEMYEKRREGMQVLKKKLQDMPEVQSVCLTEDYIGEDIQLYTWRTYYAANDSTKFISLSERFYYPDQQFFETMGLRAIEGSPDVETLSRKNPQDGVVDGVVVTRSVGEALFGTDQVVGKQLALQVTERDMEGDDIQSWRHYTIVGVVEDVKPYPDTIYPYVLFKPNEYSFPWNESKLLLRLKPEVDAEAFVRRLTPTLHEEFTAGFSVLAFLETYEQHLEKAMERSETRMMGQLASLPLGLFAINIILGTLGTFWLQIRKRKEDIGIMRAFGASKRRIFCTLLGEGAILTLLASLFGDIIWLQFNVSRSLLFNGSYLGRSNDFTTDWINQFWPHFLIISFIVFLLLLVIVSIGIALPAWNVCRRKIVEALRDE